MFCKNGDLWISRKYCSAQDLGGFEKVSSAKSANGLGTWGMSNEVLVVLLLYDQRRPRFENQMTCG
jgi:hypothetical protein